MPFRMVSIRYLLQESGMSVMTRCALWEVRTGGENQRETQLLLSPSPHSSQSADHDVVCPQYMVIPVVIFRFMAPREVAGSCWRLRNLPPGHSVLKMEAVFLVNIRYQGLTNTGRQVAQATEFCTVATKICGSSAGNLQHLNHLATRILR